MRALDRDLSQLIVLNDDVLVLADRDRSWPEELLAIGRRDYAGRPGRDWTDVRDQLLTLAIEWDLADDTLDHQSDACLRALAVFLR